MEFLDKKTNRAIVWQLFSEIAELADIPVDILYSLAQTESGRYLHNEVYPWPWTLSKNGKRQFYGSRRGMHEDLVRAVDEGGNDLRIGALQICLKRHGEEHKATWETTNPFVNVELGARFLKQQFARHGNWWKAVATFHGPCSTLAERIEANDYCDRVKSYMSRNRLNQSPQPFISQA